jgi:hypothetical protein
MWPNPSHVYVLLLVTEMGVLLRWHALECPNSNECHVTSRVVNFVSARFISIRCAVLPSIINEQPCRILRERGASVHHQWWQSGYPCI